MRTLVQRRTLRTTPSNADTEIRKAFTDGWQVVSAVKRGCACEFTLERSALGDDADDVYLGHA